MKPLTTILLLIGACVALAACESRGLETGSIGGGEETRGFAQSDRGNDDFGTGRFTQRVAASSATSPDLNTVDELPPPLNSQGGRLQFIARNDVIEVDVFGVDELDRTVEVDSTGQISLPLVGQVIAAGKTERQLEAELRRLYGARYLEAPQINVNVKESAGQRVTVEGEVIKAGIYPISSRATLLRSIAQAQGFSKIANPSKVYVFRKRGKENFVANYDVDAIRAGKRSDPRIYGGDIVVVFSSSGKVAMENLKSVLGIATSAGRLAVLP
ncbi:MAG: polysaccharide export protein [Rhodobacteraceae bacterium]|nr:polysaccharide export protein [Paracoccaceae bacterium]